MPVGAVKLPCPPIPCSCWHPAAAHKRCGEATSVRCFACRGGQPDPVAVLAHVGTYQQHMSQLMELVLAHTLHSLQCQVRQVSPAEDCLSGTHAAQLEWLGQTGEHLQDTAWAAGCSARPSRRGSGRHLPLGGMPDKVAVPSGLPFLQGCGVSHLSLRAHPTGALGRHQAFACDAVCCCVFSKGRVLTRAWCTCIQTLHGRQSMAFRLICRSCSWRRQLLGCSSFPL